MREKIALFVQEYFLAITIVLITIVLVWINYTPGTWLSGWDTLHPEFDFPLNIKRLIFGVWREDQGLGAVAAHSHMSELPRLIIMWLSSIVFPISTLRYFYVFLCLILGPLGVYFFLEKVVFRSKEKKAAKAFSFTGGIFYLLNLGTLQNFYVPFEMFTTQYAALGWLFLFATRYLEERKRKDLILFSVITLLATPQAYAATLFYAYLLAFVVYLAVFTLPSLIKRDFSIMKRSFMLLLLIFTINAFWLLPNLYYLKTVAPVVPEAKMNKLFSEEAFLKNQKFGNLKDVAILKGFLFDWMKVYGNEQKPLFDKWIAYQKNPYILPIGYIAFVIILWGILKSFTKPNRYGLYLIPFLILSYFFLTGTNSPFSDLYSFFRNDFPLFKEALRMPWTKFSLLLMFSYSVFFALGNYYIYEVLKKRISKIYIIQTVIWLVLLVAYMYPAFKGELIAPIMRVKIPQEYFSAFKWINEQSFSGRIANFPSSSYAGWEVYQWGFQGAGFFWFGEKMPFLARDFDRWVPYNENYYHEISYAVYSKNKDLFEKLLEKYQVSLVLVDESIVSQTTKKDFLYLEQLKEMIKGSNKLTHSATFGKLSLYRVNNGANPEKFVFMADNLPKVGPVYRWNNYDRAFTENGSYLPIDNAQAKKENTIYYPFRSLFTGRKQSDLEFGTTDKGEYFLFASRIPQELAGSMLYTPPVKNEDVSEINKDNYSASPPRYPEIFLDGELVLYNQSNKDGSYIPLNYVHKGKLEIRVPKVRGFYSYDSIIDGKISDKSLYNCSDFSSGKNQSEIIKDSGKKLLRLTSLDSSSCVDMLVSNLSQRIGFLATIESRNIEGESLLFSLVNKSSDKSDGETYLPNNLELEQSYFVVPPMEYYGLGYSLFFKNISIGQKKSTNDLGRITINPIPYNFLTSVRIVKNQDIIKKARTMIEGLTVDHPNSSFYQVGVENNKMGRLYDPVLILSQSFNEGWKAYKINTNFQFPISNFQYYFPFFFGEELKEHVLVNNWANGWKVNSTIEQSNNETIIIVFWPQYLEFGGLAVLGLSIASLVFLMLKDLYLGYERRKKRNNTQNNAI